MYIEVISTFNYLNMSNFFKVLCHAPFCTTMKIYRFMPPLHHTDKKIIINFLLFCCTYTNFYILHHIIFFYYWSYRYKYQNSNKLNSFLILWNSNPFLKTNMAAYIRKWHTYIAQNCVWVVVGGRVQVEGGEVGRRVE